VFNVYVPPTSSNVLNDRNIDFYEEIEKGIEQNRTLFRFAQSTSSIKHIYTNTYIFIYFSLMVLYLGHKQTK